MKKLHLHRFPEPAPSYDWILNWVIGLAWLAAAGMVAYYFWDNIREHL